MNLVKKIHTYVCMTVIKSNHQNEQKNTFISKDEKCKIQCNVFNSSNSIQINATL